MTAHAILLPVLVPAAGAAALLLVGGRRRRVQRALNAVCCGAVALAAISAAVRASSGAIDVYQLGGWPAPFGISLVLDRLAALMLLVTAAVAVAALAAALSAGPAWEAGGRHFHPLFQFQLMGLNGAFLTGDLFNLFVFFEILLLASYGLLVHGGGRERLRAGLHYVVVNLAASSAFLIGIALLYAVAGTLNLADLALRVPQVAAADAPLVRAAALLLLVVFAVKAAVFPLFLWLPGAYSAAAAPIAALFAIMTKVGVYGIVRVHGVVFGPDAGLAADVAGPWVLGGGLATAAAGVLGVLAAPTLAAMAAYLTVMSVGTVLIALGVASAAGTSAALYYLVHSTLVTAALFLLAEAIASERGQPLFERAVPLARPAVLGTLFLVSAASVAGLPPLSGFVGKLAILQASVGAPAMPLLWVTLLGTGLLATIALARAGSAVFWRTAAGDDAPAARRVLVPLAPVGLLLAGGVALAVFAEPALHFTTAAAAQLRDRMAYATRVLGDTDRPAVRAFPTERRP